MFPKANAGDDEVLYALFVSSSAFCLVDFRFSNLTELLRSFLLRRSQRSARKLNKNSHRNLYLGIKGLWSGTVVYVLEEHKVDCNETEVFCCHFHRGTSQQQQLFLHGWLLISEDAFMGERVHRTGLMHFKL